MSTMGLADCGGQWPPDRRELLERIFMDSVPPVEPLAEELSGRGDGGPFLFGAVGLFGRFRDGLDLGALSKAFQEVGSCIALPELALLLVRADADFRITAENIRKWLRERGLTLGVAYLPGKRRLADARQVRSEFEAAAGEMFFRSGTERLPLQTAAPRNAGVRKGELRRLRQDITASLVRGEAGGVHERLEEYFRLGAQGGPAFFREQCAGLYFRVGEELAVLDEKQNAFCGSLLRSGKSLFQLTAEANCAAEIMEHVSWYMDQLLAWYRPLRETTSSRVATFVEAYIRSHYMEPVDVEDIAARVGLSANYVRSIFKNSRGQTIQSYLSEYRLEMACQLLRSTSVTVSRVGQMVGYNNVSYFCASFQKRFGKTPSEWRREL